MTRPAGVRVLKVQRVLRFDGPPGRGLWWRPSGAIIMAASRPKTFTTGLRPMANHTTAPIGQSIKRKALLWAGYGPTSTDLHILCRMCTARGNAPLLSPMATSLHGKASHMIFRSLSLPYKSRSLATPEGEILAALCLDVLMRPKAERRASFPLRGGKGTGFVGEQGDLRIQ